MNTVAQNSCLNGNTGSAEIIPSAGGNYQYSLDGITFSSSTSFTNLGPGSYTIYVQEDNSCIYEYPLIIAASPEPQFDLLTGESCSTSASGTLDINPLDAGVFEYSLDNSTFSSSTNFINLAVGVQTPICSGD